MDGNDKMAGGGQMSGYILCQTRRAKIPYFIENIRLNIYSIEELCYYLYNNLYLIDQTLINERLCVWLQEELELPALAAKLRPHLGKFACAEDILYPIFKEINYLNYEELKALNIKLQELNAEAPAVREKRKADALMENGMYVHAAQVYQKILQRDQLEKIREGLTGEIYHNLGCAFSYLFQMDKAADCFKNAYSCKQSPQALETYLAAFRLARNQAEYEKLAETLGADAQICQSVQEKLEAYSEIPDSRITDENADEVLDGLLKEYHKCTGS